MLEPAGTHRSQAVCRKVFCDPVQLSMKQGKPHTLDPVALSDGVQWNAKKWFWHRSNSRRQCSIQQDGQNIEFIQKIRMWCSGRLTPCVRGISERGQQCTGTIADAHTESKARERQSESALEYISQAEAGQPLTCHVPEHSHKWQLLPREHSLHVGHQRTN